MGRLFYFLWGLHMINASGVIRNILNGTITLKDFVRDMEAMYQFSSGAMTYNFVVNSILSMGCRIALRDDDRVVALPLESPDLPLPPSYMFIRSHEPLPFIGAEPFAFLKTMTKAFTRLEIVLPLSPAKNFVASPWRAVIERSDVPTHKGAARHAPPQMLSIPVLCLLTGKIKLLRISSTNYAATPANVLNGDVLIAVGKAARRKLTAPSMVVSNTYDEVEALARVHTELNQITADYDLVNVVTLQQASLLRNTLDIRNRDAKAMQRAILTLHSTTAPLVTDE